MIKGKGLAVSRFATVELHKDDLKFSAGHFMIFSDTERETMHGHDYQVNVALHTLIEKNGMSFDIRFYKNKVLALCKALDYRFILPQHSEFLRLEETAENWLAHVNGKIISFQKRDVTLMPITNVTLEEISNWFLEQLTADLQELKQNKIHGITVQVFNGRSQSGSTDWGSLAKVSQPQHISQLEMA
jgi:6-pyruvoyltetrahydropterin/6-carboxytetrahydropterin synthase